MNNGRFGCSGWLCLGAGKQVRTSGDSVVLLFLLMHTMSGWKSWYSLVVMYLLDIGM